MARLRLEGLDPKIRKVIEDILAAQAKGDTSEQIRERFKVSLQAAVLQSRIGKAGERGVPAIPPELEASLEPPGAAQPPTKETQPDMVSQALEVAKLAIGAIGRQQPSTPPSQPPTGGGTGAQQPQPEPGAAFQELPGTLPQVQAGIESFTRPPTITSREAFEAEAKLKGDFRRRRSKATIGVPQRSVYAKLMGFLSGTGTEFEFLSEDEQNFAPLEALNNVSQELINLSGSIRLAKVPGLVTSAFTKSEVGGKTALLLSRHPLLARLWNVFASAPSQRAQTAAAASAPFAADAATDDGIASGLEVTGAFILFEAALAGAARVLRPLLRPLGQNLREGYARYVEARLQRTVEEIAASRQGPAVAPEFARPIVAPLSRDEAVAAAEALGMASGDSLRRVSTAEFLKSFRKEFEGRIEGLIEQATVSGTESPVAAAFMSGVARGTSDAPLKSAVERTITKARPPGKRVFKVDPKKPGARELTSAEKIKAVEDLQAARGEIVAQRLADAINPEPGVYVVPAGAAETSVPIRTRAKEIVRARIEARGGPTTTTERNVFFPDISRSQLLRQSGKRAAQVRNAADDSPALQPGRPRPEDRLSPEEVWADTGYAPEPPGSTASLPTAAPEAPVGTFQSLEGVRAEAAKIGFRVRFVEATFPEAPRPVSRLTRAAGGIGSTSPVPKAQVERRVVIEDATGKPIFTARTLRDALAEVRARSGRVAPVFVGETANQTLIADDPDDTPEERAFKVGLRNAIRTGTVLGMLGPLKARPRKGLEGEGFFNKLIQGGAKITEGFRKTGRFTEVGRAFKDVRLAFQQLYFMNRRVEDILRNQPDFIKVPVQQFLSTNRLLSREWADLRQLLYTDLPRRGIREGSITSEYIGSVLDVIDSPIIAGLPIKGDPAMLQARWLKALEGTMRRKGDDLLPAQINLAEDAIRNMRPIDFETTKMMQGMYTGFRRREIAAFEERFAREQGVKLPFVISDENGKFLKRVATTAEADRLIASASKRNKRWTQRTDTEPTAEEIVERIGPTQSAYLPRLIYDSMRDRYNIDGLIEEAPWADPVVLLREIENLLALPKEEMRRGFEGAFGLLRDGEFDRLRKTSMMLIADSNIAVDRTSSLAIPRELYVKFYKARFGKDQNYSRDAVRGMAAYASTVLRDIHYGPQLPVLREAMRGARAKGLHPAVMDEVAKNIDFVLGRERPLNPALNRLIGKATGLAYGGTLAFRTNPAFNNLVGQIMLVGIPEMGADSALAGLVAMSDPAVIRALAQREIIWNALPMQERSIFQALRAVRGSKSPTEAIKAMKDLGISSGDFLGMTEHVIRSWAFLGGMAEALKRRGLLGGTFPGSGLRKGTAIGNLNTFVRDFDNLAPEVQSAAVLESENMVGRVAFWFETASTPRMFRAVREFPGGGLVTMFMNFPINYMNRFISVANDAFGRRIPKDVRQGAFGKIIRHLNMTVLVTGPMGLPIINELINDVSDQDEDLGGRLRVALQPYQNYWAATLPEVYTSRDLERFSTFQPLEDALMFTNPQRFPTAPVPRVALRLGRVGMELGPELVQRGVGKLFGLDIPIDAAFDEKFRLDAQRALGPLAPIAGVPEPEGFLLPEALALFIHGGGAMQDYLNFLYAKRAQAAGLPGPLDAEHRLRESGDPAARFFLGPAESTRRDRANVRNTAKIDTRNEVIVRDTLNAATNPLTSDKERARAFAEFQKHPFLIDKFTEAALTRTIANQQLPPSVRRLRDANISTIQELFPILLAGLEGVDSLPLEEQRKRYLSLAIAAQRLMKQEGR